ncbi:MAG: 3',5'-cyclic-nucleotide phosphodiesterase [Planctomycetota bacterium]|nr:MAG: 3',5'-cyclic-nucleotide phosphodiesterase [Planctomycetota bacterium]
MNILHISDLHFGPPFVPRVGQALLDIAPSLQPDAIVVSGDLTQRAKESQFKDAAAFLQQLPDVPRVVIPGNHDVPLYRVSERIRDPHGLYRKYISPELNQVLRIDGAVIVGLDSTSPRRSITNGRLTKKQLDFCSAAFADAPPDAIRIVVAHHHFAPAPDYLHDQTMPKARRAIERFVDLGVDMILGGHLHRAYIGNSLDFYPGNHRDKGIIIVQSGTTTSRRGRGREREKNSFNLVQIDGPLIRITHFMFFDQFHRFAPLSQHLFARAGGELQVDVSHAAHLQVPDYPAEIGK